MTKDELNLHWSCFLTIDSDFKLTDRYVDHGIFGSCQNKATFSIEFSKLLLLICNEFEAMCRLMNKHIDSSFDLKSKIDILLLSEKIVSKYPSIRNIEVITLSGSVIKPLKRWCKKSKSGKWYLNLNWWEAYNNLKHNRHENFHRANLKNVTEALASLYVLFIHMAYELREAGEIHPVISLQMCTSMCCKYTNTLLLAAPNEFPPGFI